MIGAFFDWILERFFGIESEATVRRRYEELIPYLDRSRSDEPGGRGLINWFRFH